MTPTLSLKTCQAIQSLGVEVESDLYWDSHATAKNEDGYGITSDGEYPVYVLSDLPAVLKAIGEKKGWPDNCCQYSKVKVKCYHGGTMANRHFLEICHIFAKTGSLEGEAEEYIMGLLK